MISVNQAYKTIAKNRPELPPVLSNLSDAIGTYTIDDVKAKLTQPPFDASAMDGFAVHLSDVGSNGNVLTVIGEAPAGKPFSGDVLRGQAVRLFTGSVMPSGANHVIMQENVLSEGSKITVTDADKMPRHIRKAGIDFSIGDVLVASGTQLAPAHIAIAAAGNHAKLKVRRRPLIAFIANGDELRPPGSELEPGQIISSNQYGLSALVESWGADALDLGIAGDTLESITDLIEQAACADIIVPIGGASVGDHDHMRTAFANAGFELLFEKISVKPGKPTWFAKRGDQRVLGLPGNPASATVCAHLFLKHLIGINEAPTLIKAQLAEPMASNGPRETYARARLALRDEKLAIYPFPKQDSSLLSPLAEANILVKIPASAGPWKTGDMMEAMPLNSGLSL